MPWRLPVALSGKRASWLPLLASAILLAGTLSFVERGDLWRRLQRLDAAWAALAVAIFAAQFALSGLRWWFLARRLGVPLTLPRAVGEYFLAGLLNQILPLGILGDVTRAIRHARDSGEDSPLRNSRVVAAILLDRASGQVAVWAAVATVLPAWWTAWHGSAGTFVGIALVVSILLAAVVLLAMVLLSRLRRTPDLRELLREMGWALAAPSSAIVHLSISLALVLGHVLAFVAIARGLGVSLPLALAGRIVPVVLVATSLPAFLAGWGIREATVAGLFALAGLNAADGVTVALLSGGLSLVASIPGVLTLRRRSPAEAGAAGPRGAVQASQPPRPVQAQDRGRL